MSQSSVERIIGVLVTDEALRRRFLEDPQATLRELAERGYDLNGCERRALACTDPAELARFAATIDARLQKTDLKESAGVEFESHDVVRGRVTTEEESR